MQREGETDGWGGQDTRPSELERGAADVLAHWKCLWRAWGQGVCAARVWASAPRQRERGGRQYLAQPAEGYVEGQGEEVLHQLFKSFGQVLELLFLQAEPQQNPSCNAES